MSARDFLGGAVLGAGLMYFLDPERGQHRRERVRAGLATRTGQYGSRLGDIDGLEAANLRQAGASIDLNRVVRLAGGVLAAYGLVRRGKAGSVIRTLGLGLAATGGQTTRALPPGAERRRTVDIQKTLYVEAPLEQVYAFGSNCENFPLFISDVREVRELDGGQWRWAIDGAPGQRIGWLAVITEQEPNRLLAWRSEPGSVLDNAGVIRFGREGSGTRVDFRFCYSRPAGTRGQALGQFFGPDPRTRLNADLGRLKTLLESPIRSDSHG